MKIHFVPLAWVERGGVCHSFEIEAQEQLSLVSELEEAVYANLLEFCTPSVCEALDRRLANRESARFAKAA